MLDRLARPVARLGANVIDGIWRIGVMARFFSLVLAASGTSFSRFSSQSLSRKLAMASGHLITSWHFRSSGRFFWHLRSM